MRRSTDRILTTHTGSLPRPADLVEMLQKRESGATVDEAVFTSRVQAAVDEIVRRQVEAGIDIVGDGEQGKPGYATYIKDRVSGFGGRAPQVSQQMATADEVRDFPEYAARRAAGLATGMISHRPTCDAPLVWKDFQAVQRDIDNLTAVAKTLPEREFFMSAASPGVISRALANEYYPTEDAYLDALASIMREEYNAITRAGFILQLDAPDLAGGRNNRYAGLSAEDYHRVVERHVAVINEATKDIDPDRMRLHLCWGNYEGPHHTDVPLREIVGMVLQARPNGISLEGANPRHAHEWNVWKDVKLPDEKVLYPGVIDSTSNFIEHPELVAQRINQYAAVVGRERVIASSDCGFGTSAGFSAVDARIAWAKLKAMAEGAELASKELWG